MTLFTEDYLVHHGIKGQKWGVRRFQNNDGSLTTAGKARYGIMPSEDERQKSRQRDNEKLPDPFDPLKSRKPNAFEKAASNAYSIYANSSKAQTRRQVKKDIKDVHKQMSDEARKKSVAEYEKASEYAKKHGISEDDVVDEYQYNDYIKKASDYGISKKQAEHVVNYNKMLRDAESKESKYYAEAHQKAEKMLNDKWGKETIESVRKTEKLKSNIGKAAVAAIIVGVAAKKYLDS